MSRGVHIAMSACAQSLGRVGVGAVRPSRAGLPFVQRKCACGKRASGSGASCDDCAQKKPGLHTKLALGAPDDAFEREADLAADRVMRGANAPAMASSPIVLRRLLGQPGTASAESVPASVQGTLAGSGQALDSAPRVLMERQFGRSFADVR